MFLGGSSQMVSELWVSTVGTRDVRSELVFGSGRYRWYQAKVTPDSSSVYSLGRYKIRALTRLITLPIKKGLRYDTIGTNFSINKAASSLKSLE